MMQGWAEQLGWIAEQGVALEREKEDIVKKEIKIFLLSLFHKRYC